jgi:hypothetical protein
MLALASALVAFCVYDGNVRALVDVAMRSLEGPLKHAGVTGGLGESECLSLSLVLSRPATRELPIHISSAINGIEHFKIVLDRLKLRVNLHRAKCIWDCLINLPSYFIELSRITLIHDLISLCVAAGRKIELI